MLSEGNISFSKQKYFLYVILTVTTLAVFWQVHHFNFISFDDPIYITENIHIRGGITPDSVHWAFSTTHAEFWHPLTWLSLMLDYQLYGLNGGGYHLTNLILHIMTA